MTASHVHSHRHADAHPDPPPKRRRSFAFDMDGVLYREGELIDGAIEAVTSVRALNLPVFFVTNNSRETPEQIAVKLQQLGVDAGPEEIVSAVVATVEYLRNLPDKPEPVLVIGGDELAEQIAGAGFKVASFDDNDQIDLVVAGVDFNLTYPRLTRAVQALVNDGAEYIAVNQDPLYPTVTGLAPGAGAITAALTASSGIVPTVIGKPSPHLFNVVLERSQTSAQDLVVIGDMLQSDIAGATNIGATAILVLTGTTSRAEAEAATGNLRPNIIIDSLWDLPLDQLLSS